MKRVLVLLIIAVASGCGQQDQPAATEPAASDTAAPDTAVSDQEEPKEEVAKDTGLTYTGKAKSWSIENHYGGYYFKCSDNTGGTYITIIPTEAMTKEKQFAEVMKEATVTRGAVKTYQKDIFTVYEFHKEEWPKTNYHIYFTLKGKLFVVRWFDMPNKPGSGKAVFNYLGNIKAKPNKTDAGDA